MKRLDNVEKRAAEKEQHLHLAKTKEVSWLALAEFKQTIKKMKRRREETAWARSPITRRRMMKRLGPSRDPGSTNIEVLR